MGERESYLPLEKLSRQNMGLWEQSVSFSPWVLTLARGASRGSCAGGMAKCFWTRRSMPAPVGRELGGVVRWCISKDGVVGALAILQP